ncbi:hypothetical protein [Halovivax cerinus]|uniref:Uncharacterized protein n=1 Tax=Halovivax cerinus TaxID=1487865 RepID=A0ABD5NK55_9EURY|nr:hypothetical protein [Halovivax cerinus]
MHDTDPTGTTGPSTAPDATKPPADPTETFETRLAEVIFSAYGRGAAVETTLEIDGPTSDAPDWLVTIEKRPPAERTYNPTLLDDDV